jgi:hypothetical protein
LTSNENPKIIGLIVGVSTTLFSLLQVRSITKRKVLAVFSIHVTVGNKTPTIAENIHIITAIMNALIHPIPYNPLKANNHAIPPIVADNKPLPSKKCAMP